MKLVGALLAGAFFVYACDDVLAPRPVFGGMMSGASFSSSATLAASVAIRDTIEAARANIDTAIADPEMVAPLVRGAVRADSQLVKARLAATDTLDAQRVKAHADSAAAILTDSIVNRPQWKRLTQYAQRAIREALRHAAVIDSIVTAAAPVDTTPPDTVVTPPPPPPDTTPVPAPSVDSTAPVRAELPRVVPSFAVPAPSRSYVITSGLQTALDTAKAGDELRLSGTFTGNFVRRGCGNGWVTIRSNADDAVLPAPGVRIDTTYAKALPLIQTPNTGPALTIYGCNVRLMGVEVSIADGVAMRGVSINYGLLWIGDYGQQPNGQPGQTTLEQAPQNIWLDRVYVHARDSTSTQRCVALQGGATIISNSLMVNCHAWNTDAQAIGGWNGPGPYLIENNDLQGGAENIMFGGADPKIPGLSPSDITIRRNWIHKDPAWRQNGVNLWTVKNLVELKNARRVLFEQNVIENTWVGGQQMAIVFKSAQGSATISYPFEGTQDVTFRWNLVRNAPGALNLQAYDATGQLATDTHLARITVEDNLFDQIGAEGDARLQLFTQDLADILVQRNTFVHAAPRGTAAMFDVFIGAHRVWWVNNVFTIGAVGNGGFLASGGAVGSAAMTTFAGTSWRYTGNALVGGKAYAAKYPANVGNTFPDVLPATGGVDRATLAAKVAGVVSVP